MTNDTLKFQLPEMKIADLTDDEREELEALELLSPDGEIIPYTPPRVHPGRPTLEKWAVHAPEVLNESYNYSPRPSSFSRALAFTIADTKVLLISGTASVTEAGQVAHAGDFRAQTWRTYRNITQLLKAEDMTWHDVVRTTCYLKDIQQDYRDFNEIRTFFFRWLDLDPLPASTGVQSRLCWDGLLVEIDAIALAPLTPGK